MRCDLQIFSGCVCHLEQLHAQSPFLFPIVFSINSFFGSPNYSTDECEICTGSKGTTPQGGELQSTHFGISFLVQLPDNLQCATFSFLGEASFEVDAIGNDHQKNIYLPKRCVSPSQVIPKWRRGRVYTKAFVPTSQLEANMYTIAMYLFDRKGNFPSEG